MQAHIPPRFGFDLPARRRVFRSALCCAPARPGGLRDSYVAWQHQLSGSFAPPRVTRLSPGLLPGSVMRPAFAESAGILRSWVRAFIAVRCRGAFGVHGRCAGLPMVSTPGLLPLLAEPP